jgi:hypothetical protein
LKQLVILTYLANKLKVEFWVLFIVHEWSPQSLGCVEGEDDLEVLSKIG